MRATANQAIRLPTSVGLLSRLACDELKQAGLRPEPLLKKARLTARQIEDRGARLNVQSQIRFLELAACALQDPFLGFHLAQRFDPREVGLLYYVLASSEVLGDGLRRAVRYTTTANEGVALKYLGSDNVAISFSYVGVTRLSDRHQIEFWVTGLVRACRELTGRNVSPRHVRLAHRRNEDCSEFNAFFAAEVEFGAATDEIILPALVKDLPMVAADPYLHNLLVGFCEEALAQRVSGSGHLRADVENAIAALLPHGKARADEVARQLGLSERTLARRLAAEGLTFSTVLSELRLDLARRHVGDPALSISQIAWLLGYQEVSAFTHAFKRWTGRTPTGMRAQAA